MRSARNVMSSRLPIGVATTKSVPFEAADEAVMSRQSTNTPPPAAELTLLSHAPTIEVMPLYEYECKKCGHRFEKIQLFSDPMLKKCPECGGKIEQMISAPAIQFKGSGWYVTDYANKSQAPSSDGGKDSKDSKKEDKSKSERPPKDGSSKESSSKESSSKDSSSKESSSKESATKESTTRVSSSRKPDKRK